MNVRTIILLILGTWIGLVLGLSFIEAPMKFTAPGITTELGVGIGRIIFGILNKIEIFFSLSLIILIYFSRESSYSKMWLYGIVLLIAVVTIQSLILLPHLDARADLLLAGKPQPSDSYHMYYVGAEALKLIILLISFIKHSKHA